jgi:hypothetical protein
MSEDAGFKWLPHRARQSDDRAAELRELTEGFPAFLEPSVLDWLQDATEYLDQRQTERVLRVALPDTTMPFIAYWHLQDVAGKVEFLDYALHVLETDMGSNWGGGRVVGRRRVPNGFAPAQRVLLAELEAILSQGGSVWRVSTTPHWGLERRVPAELRALVDSATSADLDASRALAAAWHACYGARPDYSKAYDEAVTAVEACLLPVTTPNDKKATLGKALSHVKDTQARWTVGGLKGDRQQPGGTLVSMLETLWEGQQRHAQPDGSIVGVSGNEAEAAVSLAVTLVHWFTAGLVAKDAERY